MPRYAVCRATRGAQHTRRPTRPQFFLTIALPLMSVVSVFIISRAHEPAPSHVPPRHGWLGLTGVPDVLDWYKEWYMNNMWFAVVWVVTFAQALVVRVTCNMCDRRVPRTGDEEGIVQVGPHISASSPRKPERHYSRPSLFLLVFL